MECQPRQGQRGPLLLNEDYFNTQLSLRQGLHLPAAQTLGKTYQKRLEVKGLRLLADVKKFNPLRDGRDRTAGGSTGAMPHS